MSLELQRQRALRRQVEEKHFTIQAQATTGSSGTQALRLIMRLRLTRQRGRLAETSLTTPLTSQWRLRLSRVLRMFSL